MARTFVAVARREGALWAARVENIGVVYGPTLLDARERAAELVGARSERAVPDAADHLSFFFVIDGRLDRLQKRRA